jgi:hypothetical protein
MTDATDEGGQAPSDPTDREKVLRGVEEARKEAEDEVEEVRKQGHDRA